MMSMASVALIVSNAFNGFKSFEGIQIPPAMSLSVNCFPGFLIVLGAKRVPKGSILEAFLEQKTHF